MDGSSEKDWAAAHYRVERDSTGVKTSPRKLRRIAEQAAKHGDPIPEQAHDVVRIYDREGRIVMQRDWGQNRDAAAAEEARIVEDLLRLDVVHFRARYGIVPGQTFDDDEDEVSEAAGGEDPSSGPSADAGPGPGGKPQGASG